MRLQAVQAAIGRRNEPSRNGFEISFQWKGRGKLISDYFPNWRNGEGGLIADYDEAMALAEEFAKKFRGTVVNVQVWEIYRGRTYRPVSRVLNLYPDYSL